MSNKTAYQMKNIQNMPKISCVYELLAKKGSTTKHYIGSTLNLRERSYRHFYRFKNNKQTKKLQKDWDNGFQFSIQVLQVVDNPQDSTLEANEKKWTDKMIKEFGQDRVYNKLRVFRNVVTETRKLHQKENHAYYWLGKKGPDAPMYGHQHTEETIKLMQEAHRGRNNPMWGRFGTKIVNRVEYPFCKHGHLRTPENLMKNQRNCRLCYENKKKSKSIGI